MNRFFVLIAIWSLALISCNKSSVVPTTLNEKISGKWRHTQYYYSIGGPLIYVSKESGNQWIVFSADGKFSSNIPHFYNFSRYEILDSTKLKFTITTPPGFRLFYFSLTPLANSLSLSPADFICVEGCGDIFKR